MPRYSRKRPEGGACFALNGSRIGKSQPARKNRMSRLAAKPRQYAHTIDGEAIGTFTRRRIVAMDIAPDGQRQWLVLAGQSGAVGGGAAIERLRHGLDAAANTQILDAYFTQGQIEMAKHLVEQRLID